MCVKHEGEQIYELELKGGAIEEWRVFAASLVCTNEGRVRRCHCAETEGYEQDSKRRKGGARRLEGRAKRRYKETKERSSQSHWGLHSG